MKQNFIVGKWGLADVVADYGYSGSKSETSNSKDKARTREISLTEFNRDLLHLVKTKAPKKDTSPPKEKDGK